MRTRLLVSAAAAAGLLLLGLVSHYRADAGRSSVVSANPEAPSADLEAQREPSPAPPFTRSEPRGSSQSSEVGCRRIARAALMPGGRSPSAAAIAALAAREFEDAPSAIACTLSNLDPLDPMRPALRRAWALSFLEQLGYRAPDAAVRGVGDASLPALERALYLSVLAHEESGTDWVVYREFLTDPAPELRRAALDVNGAHWDYDVLPILIDLERDPDPGIRYAARHLTRRYLIWGPTRPTWRDRKEANSSDFVAYDREGLRAWRSRDPVSVASKPVAGLLPASSEWARRGR